MRLSRTETTTRTVYLMGEKLQKRSTKKYIFIMRK